MPAPTCFGCRRIGSEAYGGKGRPNCSLRRPMSAVSAGNSNSRCSMTASSMLLTEKPNQPEENGECGTECADLPKRVVQRFFLFWASWLLGSAKFACAQRQKPAMFAQMLLFVYRHFNGSVCMTSSDGRFMGMFAFTELPTMAARHRTSSSPYNTDWPPWHRHKRRHFARGFRFLVALPRPGLVTLRQTFVRRSHGRASGCHKTMAGSGHHHLAGGRPRDP